MRVQFRESPRGDFSEPTEAPLGIRVTTDMGVFDISEDDGIVRLWSLRDLLNVMPDALNSVMLATRPKLRGA